MTSSCLVMKCSKQAWSRGYCNAHYKRYRRYGDPEYKPVVTDYSGVDTSLYHVWCAMKNRCYLPTTKSYKNYGGRGIGVCQAWRDSYINFITDMGSRPSKGMTLDRVDNNAGYTCGHCDDCIAHGWHANVRWATRLQQSHNSSAVHWIEHDGKRLTISDWTRLKKLTPGTISWRLAAGWTVEQAINTPMRRAKRYIAGERAQDTHGKYC
jgi:hypothetical protein